MKKLFTNDKFFGTMTLLSILCTVCCSAMFLATTSDMQIRIFSVSDLVGAVCVGALFISYKNHSKNVMKGVMGALLMQIFMINLFSVEPDFGGFDKILTVISLIIIAALLMNHFAINSERKSSPFAIRLNQMLCVLYALVMVVDMVYFLMVDDNVVEKVIDIFGAIAYICIPAVIVCVESRLDAYRLDREAAGWTEEAGYPEGYVHEYEKKGNK